jgi:hypothetical protein
MREIFTALTGLAAAALLTACGGGSGYSGSPDVSQPQSSTEVPASAVASSSAMVGYLGALARTELTEPLTVAGLKPTVSETEEPLAISK